MSTTGSLLFIYLFIGGIIMCHVMPCGMDHFNGMKGEKNIFVILQYQC